MSIVVRPHLPGPKFSLRSNLFWDTLYYLPNECLQARLVTQECASAFFFQSSEISCSMYEFFGIRLALA